MRRTPDLVDRIDGLCGRASRVGTAGELLSELEDLLAEGYVEALTQEAESRRLARQLEDLLEGSDTPAAAREVRRLAHERRQIDQGTRDLRRRLDAMRGHFVRLGGATRLTTG